MKYLKKTLSDGNNYTFSTLTVRQMRSFQEKHDEYGEKQNQMNEIQFETKDGILLEDESGRLKPKKLSKEDKDKIKKLEQETFDFMMEIFRNCLCVKHKEFKVIPLTGDPLKDKDIKEHNDKMNEKIMDLIDISDLRKITSFAFIGTYEPDEDVYDFTIEASKEEDGKDTQKE